jgi:hypothetical protein
MLAGGRASALRPWQLQPQPPRRRLGPRVHRQHRMAGPGGGGAAAAAAAGAAPGAASPDPARRPRLSPFGAALVAGCAALAASGAVPRHDLAFSAAWPAYLWAANRWRFAGNAALQRRPPGALVPEPWVRRCVAGPCAWLDRALRRPGAAAPMGAAPAPARPRRLPRHPRRPARAPRPAPRPRAPPRSYAGFAALLALVLPTAACAAGRGDAAVLAAVAPHLYLTVAQVVCETFTGGGATAALPRMLVPVGFNTYRMWTLAAWVSAAAASGLGPWHVALAAANLVFWAYNLFGFLLLNMLPRYLDPAKCAV